MQRLRIWVTKTKLNTHTHTHTQKSEINNDAPVHLLVLCHYTFFTSGISCLHRPRELHRSWHRNPIGHSLFLKTHLLLSIPNYPLKKSSPLSLWLFFIYIYSPHPRRHSQLIPKFRYLPSSVDYSDKAKHS